MAGASPFMMIMCMRLACGLSNSVHSVDNQDGERERESYELSLIQVQYELLPKLNLDNSTLVPLPPLGMVKTHKTGSTTAMKIMQNLASTRGMAIMFPKDDHFLGWPGAFPGEDNLVLHGNPSHEYELIANHAVFNSQKWRGYLKPNPHMVAVLREPMSQAVSAKSYFSAWGEPISWEDHIALLKGCKANSTIDNNRWNGRFCNPQAHDLGWYEHVGRTSKYDHNQTVIRQWIDSLDLDFGHMGSIILLEYFDESLVLLKESLGVEFSELAYQISNVGNHHDQPSQDQLDQLRMLYPVDLVLYEHFNKTFWKHWQQADPQVREAQLAAMKLANSELNATCNGGSCPPVWTSSAVSWTRHLHQMYQQ